jgi:predicted RNase H-like HicB family nuclease
MTATSDADASELTVEELAAAESAHYAMLIAWSEEAGANLVTLPGWAERVLQLVTYGAAYAEAAQTGTEVLALLIAGAKEDGLPFPSRRGVAPILMALQQEVPNLRGSRA